MYLYAWYLLLIEKNIIEKENTVVAYYRTKFAINLHNLKKNEQNN